MLKFNSSVLQMAFERNVFIIETQVTPLYSCLTLNAIEPFHLDSFCPPRIALEAKKYTSHDDIYLHSVTISEGSCWAIFNANGDVLFSVMYCDDDAIKQDFALVLSHLSERHVEYQEMLMEQLNIKYYIA